MGENSNAIRPEVSIVIVSDYAAGGAKTWNDLRRLFRALSHQDYEEAAEFLLHEIRTKDMFVPPIGQGLHYQVPEVVKCFREGKAESDVMPLAEL